jgi:glycogen(starch) synthase
MIAKNDTEFSSLKKATLLDSCYCLGIYSDASCEIMYSVHLRARFCPDHQFVGNLRISVECGGLKILLYSHYFAPSIGGVETVVLSLAKGLAELEPTEGNQFQITLITEIPADDRDDQLLPFRIVRRPSFTQLLKFIRAADLLHLAGPALVPLMLGLLTRTPVVIEHHGFQTICPTGQLLIEPGETPCPGHFMAGRHLECLACRSDNNWLASGKLWILTFVRRFLCSFVAANIMPTQWLSQMLNLSRQVVISHGVELTGMPNDDRGSPSKSPLIVFQGRLVTTKGLPVLLAAASILRSQQRVFRLIVVGAGPERMKIQELAEKLQIASYVQFVGRVATAELDSTFEPGCIVVVPSVGGEVFGLVVAENMSRGRAIVASKLGSFVEILGDAGLTFRVGDAKDLAQQISRFLDDSSFASALGLRAAKRIQDKFLRSRMIEEHSQLYRKILTADPIQPSGPP